MTTAIASNTGKIVQIIGAVIDVEFSRESVPNVYEALKLEDSGRELTLEVQQQLGDGVVRCIAMGVSEGLKRGITVRPTGKGISVPVGTGTLGRIMDVLGDPQDERGPVKASDHWEIHRPAPSYGSPTYAAPVYRPAPVYQAPSYRAPTSFAPVYSAPSFRPAPSFGGGGGGMHFGGFGRRR